MDSSIKWPGGKHYLAPRLWEIARKVPHVHRVEVCGGSLAFTLASDPEGYSEVVNDLNSDLTNFWCVLQHESTFSEFRRKVEATPFSQWEYRHADGQHGLTDLAGVDAAAWFFVKCRQSLAGRMDAFAPLSKTRVRRGMNEQASAWLSAVEGLPAVHERLKRVVVLNDPALVVIHKEDSPHTLFYLDPPYLHETRATTTEYGKYEMTETEHFDLLKKLAHIKGKFMLSGYRNPMYDGDAERFGWNRHDFELPNNAAGGKKKRRMTECVWVNW